MKALTRILGIAAVAAGAAAAVNLLGKALGKERSTFAELAHETAEPAEPLTAAPQAVQQAAEELLAREEGESPRVQPAPAADAPNPNPVDAAPVVTPRTPDGKIDVTRLIDPADFADWDDLGCKS